MGDNPRSKIMRRKRLILPTLFIFLTFYGCTRHKVEVAPVEVKPIHITIDVNVKVDKALDDFFGDIDSAEEEFGTQPTSSE
jgi:hypothetical protein